MNFATVEAVTIPDGTSVKIAEESTVLWSAGSLPSTYQEVEWVQGSPQAYTSGPYIDLGFAFDTADIYIDGNFPQATACQPFGAAESNGVYRCMISMNGTTLYLYGSDGTKYLPLGYSDFPAGDFSFRYSLAPGNLYAMNLLTGAIRILTTQIAYTMTRNLYLFVQNYNTAARFAGFVQIKKFQYYDKNGDMICDLVPCYRKSDGEIDMYDLARKIFLTNAGSGSFTKGADVE